MAGFRDGDARLSGLISCAPERRTDRHGGDLAIAALTRPGFASDLVLFGQSRVEGSSEIDIARTAPGSDEDTFRGFDIDGAAFVDGGDPEYPAFGRPFADDACHLVAQ